jgi:hypothetical protein
MNEFKAKVASNSTAIAQIFNAEIAYFEFSIVNHGLFSTSLVIAPLLPRLVTQKELVLGSRLPGMI